MNYDVQNMTGKDIDVLFKAKLEAYLENVPESGKLQLVNDFTSASPELFPLDFETFDDIHTNRFGFGAWEIMSSMNRGHFKTDDNYFIGNPDEAGYISFATLESFIKCHTEGDSNTLAELICNNEVADYECRLSPNGDPFYCSNGEVNDLIDSWLIARRGRDNLENERKECSSHALPTSDAVPLDETVYNSDTTDNIEEVYRPLLLKMNIPYCHTDAFLIPLCKMKDDKDIFPAKTLEANCAAANGIWLTNLLRREKITAGYDQNGHMGLLVSCLDEVTAKMYYTDGTHTDAINIYFYPLF